MKKMGTILCTVLLAVLVFTAGNGQAFTIQGSIWDPADTAAQTPSVVPAGSPTATFTVQNLNFDSRRSTYTYDTWLQGSNSSNINGLVWLTDPYAIKDSFYTSTGKGTFMQFTGTAYFSKDISIIHDDGFWLQLVNMAGDTTTYDYSLPTIPETTKLSIAAGVYEFTLNYGAWNGMPEVLTVSGMTPVVPEPGTVVLFGFGLFSLAIYGKRRMNKNA